MWILLGCVLQEMVPAGRNPPALAQPGKAGLAGGKRDAKSRARSLRERVSMIYAQRNGAIRKQIYVSQKPTADLAFMGGGSGAGTIP
jgi:hypothetical protein